VESAVLETHVAYQRYAPHAFHNEHFVLIVDYRVIQLQRQLFDAVGQNLHVLKRKHVWYLNDDGTPHEEEKIVAAAHPYPPPHLTQANGPGF
jgi:hypothetical protein